MHALAAHPTPIPGLTVVDLPVHVDPRGWFKENWQRAKMTELGLPDFGPVQHNVAFNTATGSTRGMHAEPWDKLVSLVRGRIFGAWVDLRPGATFGTSFHLELGPDRAVYVPRGVANGYQALADGTIYSYLVNRHWSPEARDRYTYVNVADETLALPWPIPLERAELSEADRAHPRLADITPMPPRATVVVGANGQLGRALLRALPGAVGLARPTFDLLDEATLESVDWGQVGLIVNAAGYTDVDRAETPGGRRDCWAVNVTGLGRLVERARRHGIPMAHVSSDYVFDGATEVHREDEPPSPLGVYGQTKAAGEALVGTLERHWIVRTSWLIGEGSNFVATMARLADTGATPRVVADQIGRLTFADDLAAGIAHLTSSAQPGIYHLSNEGPPQSWAAIARQVFELRGRDGDDVAPATTADYTRGTGAARRPQHSTLDLTKLRTTGFTPPPAESRLISYLAGAS